MEVDDNEVELDLELKWPTATAPADPRQGLVRAKSAGPSVADVVVNSTGDQVRQQFVSLHA